MMIKRLTSLSKNKFVFLTCIFIFLSYIIYYFKKSELKHFGRGMNLFS